jgi:CheY-like chemotaxis protein
MKVLIIDDERAIRRALKEILEFEDCTVLEAENGKEGIEIAKSNSLDLIFCDIKMPVMDGSEVLDALTSTVSVNSVEIKILKKSIICCDSLKNAASNSKSPSYLLSNQDLAELTKPISFGAVLVMTGPEYC